jgi:hypothetical protein
VIHRRDHSLCASGCSLSFGVVLGAVVMAIYFVRAKGYFSPGEIRYATIDSMGVSCNLGHDPADAVVAVPSSL